jgi:K+-sensing histidine kinase KdpD
LSIAAAIAAAHGGLLAVMNRDGGGAMIRITLPWAYALRPLHEKWAYPENSGLSGEV